MPRLKAVDTFYKLTLVLPDPSQLLFQVTGADLLQGTGFTATAFNTATSSLTLPVVKVADVKYYLVMTIVANSNPIQLRLSKAVLL
jgi:hypothetical protein